MQKIGNGCTMCVLRCPAFGARISIKEKAGIKEMIGTKPDGTVVAMSGSCKLFKGSLAPWIVDQLNSTGVVIIQIPPEQVDDKKLSKKAYKQSASREFAENIILLDTWHAKLMSPFYPLEELRQIEGMENARYEDPYAGGQAIRCDIWEWLPAATRCKLKVLKIFSAQAKKPASGSCLNAVGILFLQGEEDVKITGIVTGLGGSGFSGLPLVGSLANTLGTPLNLSVPVLAALRQVGAIFSGGGTITAWAFGLVATAGVAGVSPIELARKNFIPVMSGLLVATIVAIFLM